MFWIFGLIHISKGASADVGKSTAATVSDVSKEIQLPITDYADFGYLTVNYCTRLHKEPQTEYFGKKSCKEIIDELNYSLKEIHKQGYGFTPHSDSLFREVTFNHGDQWIEEFKSNEWTPVNEFF
eukprot:UN28416